MICKTMFCVVAKHGKERANLTKPLQMYIKFLNYAPKKIIFNINSTRNCLCILLNISALYKYFVDSTGRVIKKRQRRFE